MAGTLNERLEQLKCLNLEIRRQLEQAEANVAAANLLLQQLAATGLLSDQIFLGDCLAAELERSVRRHRNRPGFSGGVGNAWRVRHRHLGHGGIRFATGELRA
jgi:hypothetical protein